MLLRSLGKLVAVIVVAGLAGLAIGIGLAKLSGDDKSSTTPPDNSLGASSPATNTTTPNTTVETTPADKKTSTSPSKPANTVRVRVVSAVLHPAAGPSGKRRRRARLSVHVRVTNRGSRSITPARPVLVSGDARLKTDAMQDAADTNLGAIDPGETSDVTLRFEIAGAVTQRVQEELRARLTIAGRNVTATVKVGGPVSQKSAGESTSTRGTAPPPPPPPPPAAQPPPPPPPPPPAGFDSSG